MTAQADLDTCREMIRHGSLSFHAASKLLPRGVCEPALALYAFCRLADDAVDLRQEKAAAVLELERRLDLVYAGRPRDTAPDRAFARMVEQTGMPRALPDALLEGLAWDAMGRRHDSFSDVVAYSARVASAVGVMMAVLMGVRDRHALARACDLGVAMQLTNIARDVGEDAREGRLYLPLDWMEEAGIDPDGFLADPRPLPEIRTMTRRLVMRANSLYYRSEAGIAVLPRACRPGIYAARLIYAGIGGKVAAAGYDSITTRAHTSKPRKLLWLAEAGIRAALSTVTPSPATLYAPPLPEVAFLVNAAARGAPEAGRAEALISALSQLAATDRSRMNGLMQDRARAS
ncbi:15-cis-phytoene synthase [Thetidibacter halocola]|uniref:Phytoene/squalene synthase family protein n=1 Tax=Thetidibacter halocola TaxID=2827239 RepID=A0A8J7WDZ2_9RHOB|nr:phytoene/squalene synthase family protein [Thetidibacter halocola]MBS0123444.1 phytoene/squalene synthase family protein [Thetidibacter halocola]